MQIVWLIVESVLLGIVCAIPELLIGKHLVRKGIVRPKSTNNYIIFGGAILGLIALRLLISQLPLWMDMIVIAFGGLGAFRGEIWLTSRRGRWWWIKDEEG